MKTCLAFLALMAAVLPAAAAVDADFGLIGITGFETARLNAFCDGSVVPTPCDITFEFHDVNGRTLKQVSMILQPETSGFADFSVGAAAFVPGRVEIDPCFKILRGTAQGSVEIFDNFTQRTRMVITWGDGARARSAADVDFGTVAITRSDIARMGASCEGDGSVVPAPCDITFEFHDANGRVLKASRMSVPAGTGAFLDLRYPEAGSTERRVLIDPCWTVANGAAVLDLQTVDSFTGLTLTQAYPAALVTSTLN
jgi:hypothetical protein